MKCVVRFAVFLAAAISVLPSVSATASSHVSASTPRPSVDPIIMAAAKEWFWRFQMGNIDRSQLDDEINQDLTPTMISEESATLKAFGKPSSFVFLRTDRAGGAFGYEFLLTHGSARIRESIAFDGEGTIVGIDFQILQPKVIRL
jgi:hypothetical protein